MASRRYAKIPAFAKSFGKSGITIVYFPRLRTAWRLRGSLATRQTTLPVWKFCVTTVAKCAYRPRCVQPRGNTAVQSWPPIPLHDQVPLAVSARALSSLRCSFGERNLVRIISKWSVRIASHHINHVSFHSLRGDRLGTNLRSRDVDGIDAQGDIFSAACARKTPQVGLEVTTVPRLRPGRENRGTTRKIIHAQRPGENGPVDDRRDALQLRLAALVTAVTRDTFGRRRQRSASPKNVREV
jgi:hypothetical protein